MFLIGIKSLNLFLTSVTRMCCKKKWDENQPNAMAFEDASSGADHK